MTHKELLDMMGFEIQYTEHGIYACRGNTEIYLHAYLCETEELTYKHALQQVFDRIFHVVDKF